MLNSAKLVFRIHSEIRLAEHVLRDWQSFVLPLSLLSIGLLYCLSPIDLISDPRPYIGHLDEAGFILLGFVSARIAIGRTSSRRTVRRAERRGLSSTDPETRPPPAGARLGERRASPINLGYVILNAMPVGAAEAERTIIISGVARSGTSMVAQIVRRGGIHLGDTADSIVHEDMEVAEALRCVRRSRMRSLIESRNRLHPVWGFKLPHLHERLAPWDMDLFRNPRLILIVRDPVAVAQRNVVSMYGYPRVQVSGAFRDLARIGRFAERVTIPVLLLSYEKAVARPDVAVRLILEFCGLDATAAKQTDISLAIQPENEAYLQAASLVNPPECQPRLRERVAQRLLGSHARGAQPLQAPTPQRGSTRYENR